MIPWVPRPNRCRMSRSMAVASVYALVILPVTVSAEDRCAFFCAPTVKLEPQLTIENLFSPGRIENKGDAGQLISAAEAREPVFETTLAVVIPTTLPRISFTAETIFAPFGETDSQPFTGGTSTQLGSYIRDNGLEAEFEVNLGIFSPEQTKGWLELHFDVVDKFSPGARPNALSIFTHKLNLELDMALLVFHRLSAGNWLRDVELEVSLDYVATGLPRAGDDFGSFRYLKDASPWGLSVVFVLPLTP